jgi:hypothetical protein
MKRFRKKLFPPKFLRNEYLMVALLLAGIVCLFFWRTIFLRESLVDSQLSINDPIYRELSIRAKPDLFFRPDPTHVLHNHPFILFSAKEIASGHIPLWSPHHEGGTPFFANFTSSPLFPPKWLFYLAPSLPAYSYYLISCLWLAGFFTYIFSRLISLSPHGAFFAAVTYMLSGILITFLQIDSCYPSALLPLVFITFQRVFTHKNLSSIALASLSVHFILLAGHPTLAFITLVSVSIYFTVLALVQVRQDRSVRRFMRHIWSLATISVLGLLLSAMLLLPFFELLQYGYTYKEGTNNTMVDFKRPGTDGIKSMASVFLPHYKIVWFTSPQYRSNTYAYQAYCGIIALILSAYALSVKPINWPLTAVFLFSSGFAFGIAPSSALNLTFPFSQVPATYGLISFSFTLIVLGGQGLDKIRENFRSFLFYGIIFVVSLLMLNFFAGLSRSLDWLDSSWEEWKSLQFSISMLILIALLIRVLRPPSYAITFIILSSLDLFYNGYWINPPQPDFNYEETSPIRKLKEDRSVYRILGMDGVSRLNTGMIHQLQDLQSYMTIILRRHREFMTLGDPQIATQVYSTATQVYDSPLWDMMNVKYILRRSDNPIRDNKYFRLVYQDPYVLIYQNLTAFPRAFIVPKVKLVENGAQALQALHDHQAELDTIAIVEAGEEKEILKKAESLDSYGLFGLERHYDTKIDSYQPHRVTLTALLSIPGFLVLSDTFYAGWRVRVDGKEEEIYPTNYLIRGVFLDKGTHSVEFYFQPTSFKVGLYVSLFGGFLTIALILRSCSGSEIRTTEELPESL